MPLRVLIVEDEPVIAMDIEGVLEDDGHIVVGIASDMHAAIRLAVANPRLDLAIMDVDLAGGTNGIETARRLREEHGVASLFVSARLDQETRARALAWNPVGFVSKPFLSNQILQAIAPLEKS